jgi:3-oxoacyl-[acyl-carrier-protein] synthase II
LSNRIVITGIGAVSAIGHDRRSFWEACLAGRSGARTLDTPWVRDSDVDTKFACPVHGFDAKTAGIPAKDVPLMDRNVWFALAAAAQAVEDAGLTPTPDAEVRGRLNVPGVDPMRLATVVGSGIGGLSTTELSHGVWRLEKSKKGVKRYALPMLIPNAAAGQVAIRFGARGESKALSTACAAGTMAIGDACRLLRAGAADMVLAGGAEGVAGDDDAYGLMGFDRLRTLSTRNDAPEKASRPFDRERDGFVLGEGAGMLVLEREEDARARGARVYAAIAGYAANCDALNMMALEESGQTIVALAHEALKDAGLSTQDVGHISAHGTSTVLNDRTEARAFRALFGPRADAVPVTGLKSMTGHAIGASGALETAALAMSMHEGVLTPTINYEFPDPECPVDVVGEARKATPAVALKFSYGFGGHNACLVLTRA